ncbi:MAG TPA: AAA family ATPase, partial [Candidatus Marinimicrobia bacterium]|nr:AAA family ATPase [Candidatus Neomarinimicrobiota bacterium]
REQTLNQLLVEMDGFDENTNVIILAATNRPDVLDTALLRPGRFDRQIVVDMPDLVGREGILKVHTKKIPLADDVDLSVLARGTPGLVGADLANLVNEAALLAARKNKKAVEMIDFEEAKDKVMMGVERRSLHISDRERRLTAYHESGHVLVAVNIPEADPIHKVTIVPRGRALGITHQLPMDERHNYSRSYINSRLSILLGGRAAEKIIFNELTTGAGNDIETATELARKMVCEWGMSDKLGPLTFGKKNEEIFLGREIATHRDFSEETARLIDQEIREIVENAEKQACEIIKKNIDLLQKLALALLEKEVLDSTEIAKILGNSEVNSANIFVNKSDDNMTKPATKAKTGSRRRKSEKEKGASTDQAA